jgi:outer membrane lipoprotein carrier protein
MRKLLLIFAAAAVAAGAVNARAGMSGSKQAKAVAKVIERHYHDAKTLRAIFLETYRAGGDELRVESGTVYFRRPGLMRWNYESPQKKLFLIDGHHAWFYIPGNHTASRTAVRKSGDWRTPFALLTGRAKLGDLCSRVSIVPSQGGPGATPEGHRVLDCEPKKGEGFLDAHIEVDRLGRIVRVLVKQPGDVDTEVNFAHWRENIPLPKSLFHFEPPKGVAIVDEQAIAGSVH